MAGETVDQIRQRLESFGDSKILTDREKKIILIKYIIHGVSPYKDAPLDLRVKLLQVAAHQYGFDYNDDEWQELGIEILKVQKQVELNAIKFLQSNKDLYKTALRNIKDGNDALIKVVDKTLLGGLEKLGLKKK